MLMKCEILHLHWDLSFRFQQGKKHIKQAMESALVQHLIHGGFFCRFLSSCNKTLGIINCFYLVKK